MPRKKKSVAAAEEPKPTYHKSKNGRYYKKMTVNGKCRCRFVSKAEGEAGMGKPMRGTKPGFTDSSSAPKKKKTKPRKKKNEAEEEHLE